MTASAETVQALERTWRTPETLWGWLTAVNHRSIGARYIITAFAFFGLAGIAALLMRLQLAFPEQRLLNADLYNQVMTMHGTTMMFLFAVPIMEGVGIYFVPLLIGARDMAFPRMNAFGYWIYLAAGVSLWLALFFGEAPDGGWFSYVPLTDKRYSPGLGVDFWATLITFLEVAALVAAVELIVTILLMRAPGMGIHRMPPFVWAILVMAFMIIFAMPAVMVASVFLALDRTLATHFFNPAQAGDPILWQHLFWFFGHPEVYIIFIPGAGMVATIVPTFARRPLIGYIPVVLSFLAVAIIGFGVWVHHMFATGRAPLSMNLQSAASFLIAIPAGVQIFSTLATFWYGRLWVKTPLLFIFGFLFVFILGGISGVMIGSIPFDWQVHDTYFLVAHFHYVLVGGAVFPLLGALFYWFPKLTGRMLGEGMGVLSFWLIFIGFNLAFFPMHLTGLLGMPRRVYTYLAGLGLDGLNLTSTAGALVLGLGFLLVLANIIASLRGGAPAPDDPWGGGTLEWATSSPPQPYNFRVVPFVRGLFPLWQERASGAGEQERLTTGEKFGLLPTRRETLGTSILDAIPRMRVVLPDRAITPLLLAGAVAITFIGFIYDPLAVPIGFVLVFIALVAWHWPEREAWDMGWVKAGPPDALPTSIVAGSRGMKSPIWWGFVLLILIETVVFAALISSYFYLRSQTTVWPPVGTSPPKLLLPTVNALILWASVIPHFLAKQSVEQGRQGRFKVALVVAWLMTALFLGLKIYEYSDKGYNWATNAYTSIVWTITGFHVAHVLAVVLKTAVIGFFAFRGYFNRERYDAVATNALYAYFVAAIWVPLYLTLYIAPYFL